MARTCTKHIRYRSFCRCRIRYRTSDVRYRTFSIRYRIQYIRYRMRYRTYDIVYDMHVRYCNCNLQRHASFIYRIRYRIRHRMRYPFIISDLYSRMLLPGPAPQPSAAPSDAGDNLPWNSDDERNFQDQQYSPPSPMSHYPGSLNPLVRFLSEIPDWNSFDKSALDHALQGLPVPIAGPAPQGISLQDDLS